MNEKGVHVLQLLEEMGKLLCECHEPGWADALADQEERLREGDEKKAGEIARELLRLFAGSGSLSDLVLHQNGEAVSEINDRFDILRAGLSRGLLEMVPGRGKGKETKRGGA
ncbi:MAG: hypothetical protein JXO51_06400 [Candidatus Aminicenantes bacterium]|nr:hypothetical protein [Candidatus Aminicenantes bacterium]